MSLQVKLRVTGAETGKGLVEKVIPSRVAGSPSECARASSREVVPRIVVVAPSTTESVPPRTGRIGSCS